MPVGVSPGQLYAKISRRRVNGYLPFRKVTLRLGVARLHMGGCISRYQHQQVFSLAFCARRHQFTYFFDRLGEALFQSLPIINQLCSLGGIEEWPVVIALL